MVYFLFFICFITLVIDGNSYVLLQVRKKDGNHSNVDAIIHKVVPSGKFDEIVKKVAVKKELTHSDNYEMRAKDDDNVRRNDARQLNDVRVSVETDTSEEVTERPASNIINIKTIEKGLFDLANRFGQALFRANSEKNDIKPEVIHFRKEKPSLVFEINSKTIMKGINDFLSSKMVEDYVDTLTRRAAVVYRSLKN